MVVISEPGLYFAIIGSQVAGAQHLKRWLTREVLPTICRTGSYGTAPAIPDITTPEGVLVMAEQFAATARQLVAERARDAKLAPHAEVADRLPDTDGDLSVADAAKALTRSGIDTGATRRLRTDAARPR
jgi:prophage antirepressor-like protein